MKVTIILKRRRRVDIPKYSRVRGTVGLNFTVGLNTLIDSALITITTY